MRFRVTTRTSRRQRFVKCFSEGAHVKKKSFVLDLAVCLDTQRLLASK